jgi:hypothetical protein
MLVTMDRVPDLSPPSDGGVEGCPPSMECPLIDMAEKRHQEAVMAAWGGIIIAILGVLSWSTYGFLACGLGAFAFGVYARRHAPMEANACFAAGALLLAVLVLRLGAVL